MTAKTNKPAAAKRVAETIALVEITNEPFTSWQRATAASEYAALFEKLGYNQRIKCPSKKVEAIAKALRTWIAQNEKAERPLIRTRKDCGDGFGGVWWLEGQSEPRKLKPKTKLASGAAWFPKAGESNASK